MNAIDISGLSKTYRGHVDALDALTMTIPMGEIVGLVGPNGAGKSTTINILAGLLKPDYGEVLIFGEKLDPENVRLKRRIGFLLERPMYFEKLTAYEYLRFVGAMYRIPRQEADRRARELLVYLDMGEIASRLAETYSAGMRKKLSLAGALLHNPDLIILDEPFDAVDPVSAFRMKETCRTITSRGGTVLLSSHQLDVVEKLCDSIIILDRGRAMFQAAMRDLLEQNHGTNDERPSLEEVFLRVVGSDGTMHQKGELTWLRR